MVSERSSNGCEIRDQPRFDNSKDEAVYWKQIAEEYIQKLKDVREEFDEYQEGSRELEAELEAQLEQYEQRVRDLLSCRCKLEEENESYKEKFESTERQTFIQVTQLQDENVQMKVEQEELSKYIRELEQSNDDLERAKRATICSLEEFDVRLNNAIERNVFLENELEEKEQLMVAVQRLKDESRDLKRDLALNSRGNNPTSNSGRTSAINSRRNSTANSRVSPKLMDAKTPSERYPSNGSINTFGSQMSFLKNKSARISALNIVSDLINKVGALESKLATCRNFSQEQPGIAPPQHMGYDMKSMPDSQSLLNGISISGRTKSWH